MQDDCIAVGQELAGLSIVRQRGLEGRLEPTVVYRKDEVKRRRCRKLGNKQYDRKSQSKQDRGLRDKDLMPVPTNRRFKYYRRGGVSAEPATSLPAGGKPPFL